MTINNLEGYRKNMEPARPDDIIQITTYRKTAEWIAAARAKEAADKFINIMQDNDK